MAGSIEKRGTNTYRLIFAKGYNLDGTLNRHTKTVHCNRKQAEIELAKFVSDIENSLVITGKSITFKQFTEIWKKDYGSKELAPTTFYRYVRILETRILPYFGKFKLDEIKPTDIMQFYDMLEKDTQIRRLKNNRGERLTKPLSKKTILEHHKLIRAMLHKAVYWQLIVNNPAERVQPPKTKKVKRKCYDEEQCKYLLEHLENQELKYKVAITITIFTGLRLGELMGLEWSDIDFTSGIISINKSSQYLAEKGVFLKDPKTESSIREVAIPTFVVDLLEEYKLWYDEQKLVQNGLWHDSNRLFVQADGNPMHPSTISKWFIKFIEEIGLPIITFHGLRHTNATLLVAQNIDIAIIAARLGHSQITTTLNFYVHPVASHNKVAGNVLQNLLVDKNE
ncbi:MAG: site-specific integrase [Eubacteriales bacterium]|nr:site-specific integrase [Eubacteriales bacterium]